MPLTIKYLPRLFLTIGLTLFCWYSSGQNCYIPESIKLGIERNFESKILDSIEYYLKKIPQRNKNCLQEFLIFKTRLFLENKSFDSVAFNLKKLDRSLVEDYNINTESQSAFLKGRYYYGQGFNDSASFYFLKALEFAKKQKDTTLQIRTLNSVSNVFANLYQYDKAISYATIGLNLSRKNNEKASEILLLGNLISYYGKNYLKSGRKHLLDSAEAVSKKLISEAKKQNNVYGLLKGYSGLGSCYFQYGNYDKTLSYSDSILIIAKNGKYPKQVLQAYGNICDSYLSLNKFSLARIAADSALSYSLKLNDKIAEYEVYYKIYDCEYELKNYKSALEYYKKYSDAKDSANAEEQFSIVNELEQKYNKFENEKTINDLLKQKEISSLRIIIGIILFIILIVIIIFIYRQKSLQQKQTILETEQRLNRSRINPHFFFNSLTSLQGIVLKENDSKKIFTNLFSFSKLMRETLESTYSDLISIEKEISFLMNYIDLQKLNQKDKFDFEVTVSDEINQESILIPSMIIQPFVENSIEHGFNEIKSGGKITLNFNIYKEELLITISDNGKGVQQIANKKHDHISRAMQITSDRLNLINNIHKSNARYLVRSNSGVGTMVEIFLPLDLKHESSGN